MRIFRDKCSNQRSAISDKLSAVSGQLKYCTNTARSLAWTAVFLAITAALLIPVTAHADRASSANKRGIEAYDNQNFEESVEQFTEAIVVRPDSPELKFNRGTALSSLNKTDEALKELKAAAGSFEKKEQAAASHFNAGNTLFFPNNLEAAIEEYKRAVMLDQSSEDIRHNLELAVRRLNEQQKQQQQDQNRENEKKKDGEEENREDQKEQEKQENEKDSQSDKTQPPEDGEQQDQNQQQSKQQDSEVMPMTEEEAQRLLDAINDDEKKALSQRYMKMKASMRQGDDW